jgi:hypothetical protein
MNPRDPFHDIGDLLRSRKPDPRPTPVLESRILRAISSTGPAPRRWPWFLLPPAVAMGVILLWPEPAGLPSVSIRPDPEAGRVDPAGSAEPGFMHNPLEREKLALQRDARRAGRFLIDCLPSLGGGE